MALSFKNENSFKSTFIWWKSQLWYQGHRGGKMGQDRLAGIRPITTGRAWGQGGRSLKQEEGETQGGWVQTMVRTSLLTPCPGPWQPWRLQAPGSGHGELSGRWVAGSTPSGRPSVGLRLLLMTLGQLLLGWSKDFMLLPPILINHGKILQNSQAFLSAPRCLGCKPWYPKTWR